MPNTYQFRITLERKHRQHLKTFPTKTAKNIQETFHKSYIKRSKKSVEYNDFFIIQVADWLEMNKEIE